MKAFILIFLLVSMWSRAACLPGPHDELLLPPVNGNISALEEAALSFETMAVRDLPPEVDLLITLESMNPRVNAEINKNGDVISISVLGGMLNHPNIDTNSFLLLLCHEIGHFLGGPPLKSRGGWSSTEGQADYFSTLNCIKKTGIDEERFLEAALKLTKIYSEVARQSPPRLDQCDGSAVTRINYGYPSVQCRLDTLLAGWYGRPRPRCWFID